MILRSHEQELEEKCEKLEQQLAMSSTAASHNAAISGGSNPPPSTPTKGHRPYTCPRPATPAKPIPGTTQLESLQNENEKLKNELMCMQTNFQLMSQKSATVKKEKKEIEVSLVELQGEFDRMLAEKSDTETKLEATRATLCNKLSSMSTGQEKQGELELELIGLRSELAEVVSQNNQLEEQVQTEQSRLETSEEFARQLKEKSKTLKEWKTQAESDISTLTSRLRELEDEVADLRSAKSAWSSERQREESEAIAVYKKKLERIRGERRGLEEKLREAGSALDEEHSKISSLEKTNKTLQRQLASAEVVQQELREQREHGSGLSKEVSELDNRLTAVTEENALLREECDRLEAEQKQTMEQIEGLTQSKHEQCERAESNEGMVQNLQKQLRRQEEQLTNASEAVREKEAHCVSLTSQIEGLQTELANIQSAKNHFESEVAELIQKLDDLEQMNFDLSTKLSEAHNETALVVATRNEHSTMLEELQQRYHDTQTLLLEKEAQLSEALYSHRLQTSENASLVAQVSTLSEMVAGRNAKIETLQTEALCYESSTRDIMTKIVSLEEEHGACARRREALEEEKDRTRLFAREGERRERELKEEISSLRSRLRESHEQQDNLQSTNRQLNHKFHTQVEKVDELVSSSHQTQTRTRHLEQTVTEKENLVASLRGELEFLTKSSNDQVASLTAEIDSLNRKSGELRAKCEDYREVEVRTESDIIHLQKQLSDLQTVHTELVHDRQPLQDRYDQTRSELLKTQDDLYKVTKELKSMKSELRYQRRKRGEAEDQLGGMQGETDYTSEQFELLREELLKILEEGEENNPGVCRRRLKGIIKQSAKKNILRPRHNNGE